MIFNRFISSTILLSLSLAIACQPKKKDSNDIISGGSSSAGAAGGASGGGAGGGSVTQGGFGIVFVSAGTVDGGTGLPSMDALCASEAATKGYSGAFKAMVNDGGNRKPTGSDWVLWPHAEYRRENLSTIISSADEKSQWPLPFTNSITATAKHPWTGFAAGSGLSNWLFSQSPCANWTDSTNYSQAYVGNTALANFVAYTDVYGNNLEDTPFNYSAGGTQSDSADCSEQRPVICVQTTIPIPTGAKRIFLSTSGVVGSSGISAMDATCAANAASKGFSGSYKAMVSSTDVSGTNMRRACSTSNDCTDVAENYDWVLAPNTFYYREGATDFTGVIGKTNSAGIFLFPLWQSFTNTSDTYWTGLSAGWLAAPSFPQGGTCGNWDQPTFNGSYGVGDSKIFEAISKTGSNGLCNGGRKVLCAEQ